MLAPILVALFLASPSQAVTLPVNGSWIDIDLEASLTQYEAKGDLKAFCAEAHYQNEEIDSLLRFTDDGKLMLCKLNRDAKEPCYQFGVLTGASLELTYQDGNKLTGQLTQPAPDLLHAEVAQPKVGDITPVEVWELHRLGESRVAHLYQAFQGCLKK